MHSASLFTMSEHLIGLRLIIFSCFQFVCKLDFSFSTFTLPYDLGIILMWSLWGQSFSTRNYSEKESSQEFAVGSRAMAEKSLRQYSYFYTCRNSKKVLFLKLSSIRNVLSNVGLLQCFRNPLVFAEFPDASSPVAVCQEISGQLSRQFFLWDDPINLCKRNA